MTLPGLLAVPPRAGAVIHLLSPGYVPRGSKRPASRTDLDSLCGSFVVFPDNRDQLAPLVDALDWTAPHQHHQGCACSKPSWRWCRLCIGHAADAADVVTEILHLILARQAAGNPQ